MANGNNSRQNRDPYINERPSQRNSFDSYFSDDHFVDETRSELVYVFRAVGF